MKRMVFFLLFVLSVTLFAGCEQKEEMDGYYIEYLNKDKNGIVKLSYETDTEDTLTLVEEFLVMLQSDPKQVSCCKSIPSNVEVIDYSLDGTMLTLWFDKNYYEMSNVEELLCRVAIVRTMTQIPEINCVTFYVNGEPLMDAQGNVYGIMYPESFVENPGEQINSIQIANLTLYFSNASGDGLIKETREVHYSSNISMEKLIMEQLLKGPDTAGLKSAIPAGTKLVSVSVVDGICYVNLDATFKNQDYSVMEPIVIYSIVNSLSEMTSISKVQISVNGDTSGAYRDSFLLSEMYVRNLDYVTTLEVETSESTEQTEVTEPTGDSEAVDGTEIPENTEEMKPKEEGKR